MKLTSTLEAIGLGALAMYFLDPDRGARRRALVRDKTVHFVNVEKDAFSVMKRDLRNRARGRWIETRGRFENDHPTDDVLRERVRAALGRCCTHPRAITVSARDGEVTLDGHCLANEVQQIIGAVRRVKGVTRVHHEMEVHESAEGISSLQGHGHSASGNGRMTPGSALLVSTAGALMMVYGMGRRGLIGSLVSAAGIGMVGKAFNDVQHRFDPSPSRNGGNGTNDGQMTKRGQRIEDQIADREVEEPYSGATTTEYSTETTI